MSTCIKCGDRVAFHPGYYVKEVMDESGLTQEEFAKRLDMSPEDLHKLINGEQKLSAEMAVRLSHMFETSVTYWLNLQSTFDSMVAAFQSDRERREEKPMLMYPLSNGDSANGHSGKGKHRVRDSVSTVFLVLNVLVFLLILELSALLFFSIRGSEFGARQNSTLTEIQRNDPDLRIYLDNTEVSSIDRFTWSYHPFTYDRDSHVLRFSSDIPFLQGCYKTACFGMSRLGESSISD